MNTNLGMKYRGQPGQAFRGGALVVGLIMALTFTGCGTTEAKKDEKEKTPGARVTTSLPIRAAAAGPGKVVETLAVQGRLEVWQRVILSPKVAGVVQDVPVLSNQLVTKGQAVLTLEAPLVDIEALIKAEAKLERARRDLDRRLKLREVAPETISITDLDAARDLVKDGELEVELYRRRETSRTIAAPFAGVLLMPPTTAAANTQTVIAGQQISEGAQVAELLDISRFRLSLDLPEPNLRRLALGQNVSITAIADDVVAKGTISAMPGAIDPTKGSGRVVVDITEPPKSWRPGGFIAAQLVLGETDAPLVLPRDAVLYRENRPYAWIAEEHEGTLVARRAWLDLGAGDERSLVVTKGVQAGERVVIEGMSGLSDGVPVSIRNEKTAAVPTDDQDKAK
ncbi:MAG TPA: efflux RND transporter periplasmic adaptor subunit [Planctomycetota bacterium]|nr:efflux RND transporter periplasmic adaptor subunit [Planctomycetota bacterium]